MTNPTAFLSHSQEDEATADAIIAILQIGYPSLEIRHYRDLKQHHPSKPESDGYLQNTDIFLMLHSASYENSRASMREFQNGYHRDLKEDVEMVIVKLDDKPLPNVAQGRTYMTFTDPKLTAKLPNVIEAAFARITNKRTKARNVASTNILSATSCAPILSSARRKRLNPDVREPGSTEHIHTFADWAVHIRPSGYRWRDEVFEDIAQGRLPVVPARLLYASYEGTRAWIRTCVRAEYSFYPDSLALLRSRIDHIMDTAVKLSNDPEFDLISIGCGNGVKDTCILDAMLRRLPSSSHDNFVYYYPMDISPYMLLEGKIHVFRGGLDPHLSQRVRTKGIWGDLAYLHTFAPVYEEFRGNNFFAVLGNTIGNESEYDVLAALRKSVLSGDFLLLEYNADKDAKRYSQHFSREDNIDRHWQSIMRLDPHATCGQRSCRELLKGDISKSYLAERTFMTFATQVKFPSLRHTVIPELGLGLLHCYDKTRIADECIQLGFDIISNDVEQGVGLLFARKL